MGLRRHPTSSVPRTGGWLESIRKAGALSLLEGVAERSVAYVMQKSRNSSDLRSLIVRLAELPSDYSDKLASHLKNADAVREPRMRGSRKDKFAESKLLDATQPLEFGRVEQRPRKLVEGIAFPESDQSVDRITNALSFAIFQNLS
jgi:hypothetical protein